MDDVMRSYREADLAFLEAANTIAFSMDTSDMDLFMESSDNKDKSGIIDKVKALVEKIKKFFEDLFSSAKIKSLKDKASDAFKNDKALEAKKVEVLDTKKIMGFSKKYKEKIKKAKSEEEIDQIVAEYNKKKAAGFAAGAVTTIGLGVLTKRVLAPAYKNANDKYIDDLRTEADDVSNELAEALTKAMMTGDEEALQDVKNAQNKAAEIGKKQKIIRKRVNVLNLMITDEMNAIKEALKSKISAISFGIKSSKKSPEQQVVESAENTEAELYAFEEGYQEFDESAVTENAKKVADAITEFIDKLIEKLKDFVDDIKNKFDSAKTKTILKSELAKSKIKIKFAFRDKDITKAVTAYEKALNNYIIALEKLSQKINAGKITIDDYYTEEGKITAQFETTLFKLEQTYSTQKTSARLNSNAYEASKVCDYLIKLENYQDKKITDIQSKSNAILNKIREEARKSADADAKVAAEKKRAAAIATATKKVIGSVVAVVGFGAAYYGICKYADKVAFKDAFSESVDELTESMTLEEFTEAAMI